MVRPPIITPSAIWAISAMVTKVTASICAFSVPFVLTCRSRNRRVSFHLLSQQQANQVLRHGLPKIRLTDHDIWAGLFFPSKRLHGLGRQPFGRRPRHPSSPTAFQSRHDAQEGFREPAFANP